MDKRRISFPRTNTRILARALSAGFAVGVIGIGAAIANPVGPQVVSGTASINQSGSTLTVTNSNGAILNWQQFNIGAGETTRFIQPSASSAVMNRVLASDPSLIYGTLSSNGKVWLVNPAGILVGPGANINVASFVASTLNISNQDFLAGRLNAIATPGAGNLVNQGRITTPSGGSVYLIGANVSNEGLITTPQGDTILAAGNSVQLLDTGTPGVKVEISGSEGNATNLGQIVAEAGRIGIAGVLVRNSGQLNASSAIAEGGRIFLRASKDAYVDGAGRIVTTGTQGGRVEVLGERVAVTDQASIDASGRQGGGTLLVGGDYQGKNPEVANANVTYFGADASLKADATDNGNGGKVVVWADDTTRALGSISARGGANGGDGGMVETSGKRWLEFRAQVDTRAPLGATGSLLLDPGEIVAYGGSGTDSVGSAYTGGVFTYGGSLATLYGANLTSVLASSDVVLTTDSSGTGNITFYQGSGGYTSASTNKLTLLAYGGGSATGNITFTSGTTMNLGGPLIAIAGWDGASTSSVATVSGKGNITVQSSATLQAKDSGANKSVFSAGGNFSVQTGGLVMGASGSPMSMNVSAQGTVQIDGSLFSYGGDVAVKGTGGVNIGYGGLYNGVINATYGGVTLGSSTQDTGVGGRILIDAGTNAFTMSNASKIGTSNQSHLIDPTTGKVGTNASAANGSGRVAIGITSGDVSIAYGSSIFLNQWNGGTTYGGGDLGFIPRNTGTVVIGDTTGSPTYLVDNTELSRLFTGPVSSSQCGVTSDGCRIWFGNISAPSDPVVGALSVTNQNIVLNQADFTSGVFSKRIQVSTTGSVNDAGTGTVGGYFGAKSVHLYVYGGAGIGTSDADGLSFYGNSINLNTPYGSGSNLTVTSVGNGDLAVRQIQSGGTATVKKLGTGNMYLLPYYSGQRELTSGQLTLVSAGDIVFAPGSTATTITGSLGTAFTETPPAATTLASYGGLTLEAQGLSLRGEQVVMGNASLTAYGANGITFTDDALAASGSVSLSASAGAINFVGSQTGTWVQAGTALSASASGNIALTGGTGVNAANAVRFANTSLSVNIGNYGAGVMVYGGTSETITSGGTLSLQAGAISNSSASGQSWYGASVDLKSGGSQTVTARSITMTAGASGHDNAALIEGFGNQSITAAYGGVGSISITGGGASGSYNNFATIRHGDQISGVTSGSGDQTITLAYGGSTISLVGGSGTGSGGWTNDSCYPTACARSNNDARIWSGAGNLTVSYTAGSGNALTITGGGASGDSGGNDAGISSKSSGTLTIGSSSVRPNITLTGGTAGGTMGFNNLGRPETNENSANISTDNNSGGSVVVYGGTVTLAGGSALFGGAFIGGSNVTVNTTGNLSLAAGSGSNGSYGWVADSAAIGNDNATTINLNVGGSLTLTGGTAYGSAALIGSLYSPSNVMLAANGITATGNTGGVLVGNMTAATGTTVTLNGGTGANVAFDAASQIRAASLTASGQGISLLGNNDLPGTINLTSTGANALGDITVKLGTASLGSVSTTTSLASAQTITFYGSSFNLGAAADMQGDSLALYASSGSIAFNGGSLFNAKNVTLNSATSGIYNNVPSATVIDTSVYGGAISLSATEIGLPDSYYFTTTGYPITLSPGSGTVSANASTGGINLLQKTGTLTTSKYTIANPVNNHVHLQSANGIVIDSALALTGHPLELIAQAGTITQSAPITATSLYTSSVGGTTLTNTGNSVTSFNAYNSGSGDIAFTNSGALTIDGYSAGVQNTAPNNGGAYGGVSLRTLAGNLTVNDSVTAYGPITLRAAGDLIEGTGQINNTYGVGTNDISVYGGNITLTGAYSQHNVAISATGNVTLVSPYFGYVDDSYFLYNLPFAFNYYGVSYTQAYISSNGLITFGSGNASYTDSIGGLASINGIAPAWNDWILRSGAGKDVFIKQPTAGTLAVQWNVARYANESLTANFETILNSNGSIKFNYGAANNTFAGDVTIGLSNGSTALVSQLMNVGSFSLNNLVSTTFTPSGTSYTETVSGTNTALTNVSSGATSGAAAMSSYYSGGTMMTALSAVNIGAGGAILGYSGISTPMLNATAVGGISLASSYISALSASNSGSGDLAVTNYAAPLTLNAISNSGTGNILIDNTGGVVVAGNVSGGGAITINAHSPITVNSGASINGAGNVTLAALSSSSVSTTDLLSVAGSIRSSGGNVAMSGGSGVTVAPTASITAPAGTIGVTSTYGAVTVDPAATVSATSVTLSGSSSSTTSATTNAVTQTVVATIQSSTSATTTDSRPTVPVVAPPTTTTSGAMTLPGSQTIGGTTGTFGAEGGSSSTGTGSSSSSSTSTPGSSSTTSASSSSSSENDGEGQKDKKDEKKDDKSKQDKTSEKKDEKSSGKKAAQCT